MKTRILPLLIIGMAYSAPSTVIADSNLIGLWHFDEGPGTTAYDSSGYNNHGTIHGAAWVTCIIEFFI